ncbi:hypothetical protein QBC47DRAFT_374428 [Echria macrotheca]|uniref:Zn(2)-C6 fungal-type domain-containing protein n=1 Tax=Echria macrotheca TaxID=438768 RepID=A0AAJ0BI53_9PEZI|nr:hypothetical protein QBC47DRAFT_374428 [Echria macrotheca]
MAGPWCLVGSTGLTVVQANSGCIDYLSRAMPSKLPLFRDDEVFAETLATIHSYEGVIRRNESLAANLGAKLMGPVVLRAADRFFEGNITTSPVGGPMQSDSGAMLSRYSPSWVDIVKFARSNPGDIRLTTTDDGRRVCRFVMEDVRVEISEDDWLLIMSGVINHFFTPAGPREEDEEAELATIEIVEQRLTQLIKQADDVARSARHLNYQLGLRKAKITSRLNQTSQARTGSLNPGYDLRADLLRQFLSPATGQKTGQQTVGSVVSRPPSITSPLSTSTDATRVARGIPASKGWPSPIQTNAESPPPRETMSSSALGETSKEPSHPPIIPLIAARIERLSKGDAIWPACDRCRRLNIPCLKHLTSCQACTKKHTKCQWNDLGEEDMARIREDDIARAPASFRPVASTLPQAPVGGGKAETGKGARPVVKQSPAGSAPAELARSRMSLPNLLDNEELIDMAGRRASVHNGGEHAPAEKPPAEKPLAAQKL